MKTTPIFWTLLVLGLLNTMASGQTSCDYELKIVSQSMGDFKTDAFNPFQVDKIYDRLNSLRASILATYQLCFGKIIIDPDSYYPRDISECLMGLYNTSLLADRYVGNDAKIKSEIDSIAKIVFSTQNDCRPVLYYKGWDNISDECKDSFGTLDGYLNKYDQEIILGKDGLQYVDDMLLQGERIRKLCGFDVLLKAKRWNNDSCIASNQNWLYPLTDKMDTLLIQKKYSSVIETFYAFYQSVYRVKDVCKVDQQMRKQSQLQQE